MPTDQRTNAYVWGITGLFLLLLIFVGLAVYTGLFRFTGSDASATVVAAALAVVGGFFGAVLSLIGVLVTQSVAERNRALAEATERRLSLDSERNATLAQEESKRLKLEAGIQAVRLFATNDGKPALRIQLDGALFTLANLGFHDLAMVLAARLLEKGEISGDSACLLIDRAIREGEPAARSDAGAVLFDHAKSFVSAGQMVLPPILLEADPIEKMPDELWSSVPYAFGRMIAARSVEGWRDQMDIFRIVAGLIANFWLEDTKPAFKQDMSAILRYALAPFPDVGVVHTKEGERDAASIVSETASAEPVSSNARRVVAELKVWGIQPEAEPAATGS